MNIYSYQSDLIDAHKRIDEMSKKLEEITNALLDIVANKPINTYTTNLGDALERHAPLIETLKKDRESRK